MIIHERKRRGKAQSDPGAEEKYKRTGKERRSSRKAARDAGKSVGVISMKKLMQSDPATAKKIQDDPKYEGKYRVYVPLTVVYEIQGVIPPPVADASGEISKDEYEAKERRRIPRSSRRARAAAEAALETDTEIVTTDEGDPWEYTVIDDVWHTRRKLSGGRWKPLKKIRFRRAVKALDDKFPDMRYTGKDKRSDRREDRKEKRSEKSEERKEKRSEKSEERKEKRDDKKAAKKSTKKKLAAITDSKGYLKKNIKLEDHPQYKELVEKMKDTKFNEATEEGSQVSVKKNRSLMKLAKFIASMNPRIRVRKTGDARHIHSILRPLKASNVDVAASDNIGQSYIGMQVVSANRALTPAFLSHEETLVASDTSESVSHRRQHRAGIIKESRNIDMSRRRQRREVRRLREAVRGELLKEQTPPPPAGAGGMGGPMGKILMLQMAVPIITGAVSSMKGMFAKSPEVESKLAAMTQQNPRIADASAIYAAGAGKFFGTKEDVIKAVIAKNFADLAGLAKDYTSAVAAITNGKKAGELVSDLAEEGMDEESEMVLAAISNAPDTSQALPPVTQQAPAPQPTGQPMTQAPSPLPGAMGQPMPMREDRIRRAIRQELLKIL